MALLEAVGAGGKGGSLVDSSATGKASTVKGGTVETGELHSVLEPLRRASLCRFRYSSRETWGDGTMSWWFQYLQDLMQLC